MASSDLSDAFARAKLGDRAAYERVVEALHGEIAVFVALRGTSRQLVEEVVQETFVAGFIGLAAYDPASGPPVAWLKGIARHRLQRALRARTRQATSDPLAALVAAAPEPAEADPATLERLRICLQRLTPAARELLTARYVADEALPDLAARLGQAYHAVATRISRLRAALRQCVAERAGEPS